MWANEMTTAVIANGLKPLNHVPAAIPHIKNIRKPMIGRKKNL
jgi:hypothetical protein